MWHYNYGAPFYECNVPYRYLTHSGVKGQKWGVRNGPPYPLKRYSDGKPVTNQNGSGKMGSSVVQDAIESGAVSKTINKDKQARHIKGSGKYQEGKSYFHGTMEDAQKFIDTYCCTGEAILDKRGNWLNKERVTRPNIIGTHMDKDGNPEPSNAAIIAYSKTGSHVYPAKRRKENES